MNRNARLSRSVMLALSGLSAAAAAATAVSPATAEAGATFETRGNYMGSSWANGWSNPANWAGVTSYAAEPGDGGGDINYIKMAHDDGYLYINFNQASQFAYDPNVQQIHFDTDLNAATGNTTDFWWHGQPTNVGAEHSMYGAAIWHYPNTSWDGDSVDSWNNYGPETGDLLIKINLLKLGIEGAQQFDWAARMFGGDDFYPNSPDHDRYDVNFNSATLSFNVPAGNFATAASWNAVQIPVASDATIIANGGTATVNSGGVSASHAYTLEIGNGGGAGTVHVTAGGELYVTNQTRLGVGGGTGSIVQDGGIVRSGLGGPDNNLRIGFSAGSTGSYTLNAGDLGVADSLTIGHNGTGTFTMNGGSISRAGFMTVGNNPGANGTFNMHGGTVNRDFGDFEVGDEAVGVANIDGGTFTTPGGGWRFSIGNRALGTGTANVSGTAVINTDNFTVGKAGNGTATLGGSAVINAFSSVSMGNDAGGVGVFTMNGGTINDEDDFLIGNFGTGTFHMNGGTIAKAGWIVVGNNPGSNGTFNMNGGTINQTFGDLEVGDEASGVFNQSGGAVNIWGNIYVSNRTGGVGDANVSGGTLTAQNLINKGTFDASGSSVTTLGSNALGNNPGDGFIDGSGTMTVAGNAIVNAVHVRQSSLTMSGGRVNIKSSGTGTAAGVSVIPNYSLSGNARLDLSDNKLITNITAGTATGGTYNGVQGDVQRASNFGAWDQPGLTTSKADAVAGLTTIGVATGAQVRGLGPTDTDTFAGQTINGATVIAMYTYAGDANLDGTIDGGDYGIIDNFVQVPNADGYANGDFNYDGVIDGGDYGIIDNNIQAQGAPFSTSGASVSLAGVTAVPEPAAAVGFAFVSGIYGLVSRRRRRDHRVRMGARE